MLPCIHLLIFTTGSRFHKAPTKGGSVTKSQSHAKIEDAD